LNGHVGLLVVGRKPDFGEGWVSATVRAISSVNVRFSHVHRHRPGAVELEDCRR
jgi:hypothetical protein